MAADMDGKSGLGAAISRLEKGVYSVTFNEGIKVPADCAAKITHR